MCCRCAVVVVIDYHLCTVDVWFASGVDVYLQHIYSTSTPEANYLQNICTVDVRCASGGRCAVVVM